jgi:hypothetical protein
MTARVLARSGRPTAQPDENRHREHLDPPVVTDLGQSYYRTVRVPSG